MQKNIWEREYRERKDLPSTRTREPSRVLVWYIENFVETGKVTPGSALDIGSGFGRNSIHLAKRGYDVVGVEIVRDAIETAGKEAEKAGVAHRVRFVEKNVGEPLSLEDASFDLIIDMMTMHSLNREERAAHAQNVVRLLKPNGHFLFYTIFADSPDAKELFNTSPGPELNSYIIPQTGAVEKAFTKDDLTHIFSPLIVVELEIKSESIRAFDKVYDRQFLLGVMGKG